MMQRSMLADISYSSEEHHINQILPSRKIRRQTQAKKHKQPFPKHYSSQIQRPDLYVATPCML